MNKDLLEIVRQLKTLKQGHRAAYCQHAYVADFKCACEADTYNKKLDAVIQKLEALIENNVS